MAADDKMVQAGGMNCKLRFTLCGKVLPLFDFFLLLFFFFAGFGCSPCAAAPKTHVIAFGKWTSAKWPDANREKMLDLKVRPLLVDGRVKEYATGNAHEVTERLFVARRVFRINDALPGESAARWQWQRGGWLLVDRLTGHISQLSLPEFDPFYSNASWYRDYIAYCGVSEDGKKLFAMVAQIGRRKPILKKDAGEAAAGAEPDSECAAPAWERTPTDTNSSSPCAIEPSIL
jgi:hypothetical protein